MESPSAATPSPARALPWLLPAWLLGALLRLHGVRDQVLVGDETHGLRSALTYPLETVLTTYRTADPCIPLAALYRILAEYGVGLSEVVLRLPSIVAGLALLVTFPLLLAHWERSRRGLAWAVLFAWLLAISPGLVYYSRIARPYGLVAFLAPLAAAAFWRWWRGGGHGWAALYAAAGALSAWLHLASVPFVAVPLAFAAADALFRGRRGERAGGRGLHAVVGAGAGLAVGVAAFLAPAWQSFLRLLKRKAAGSSLDLAGVVDVLRLEAGSVAPVLAALFWAGAAAGAVVLLRGRRRAALFGATLVVAQWLGIVAVLRPDGVSIPLVAHRYLLVTLPVVLVVASRALAAIWEWARTRPGALLPASGERSRRRRHRPRDAARPPDGRPRRKAGGGTAGGVGRAAPGGARHPPVGPGAGALRRPALPDVAECAEAVGSGPGAAQEPASRGEKSGLRRSRSRWAYQRPRLPRVATA